MWLLVVRNNPEVSIDACIVEKLIRQGNYRLKPIVFNNPAADFAFARADAPCEER